MQNIRVGVLHIEMWRYFHFKFILSFIVGYFYFSSNINAQESQHKIECLARVKQDAIFLRWGPSSIPAWQSGNLHGYLVYRYTLVRDGNPVENGLSEGLLLTPEPIKVFPEEQLEQLSEKYPEADVLIETIYGKDFQIPNPDQGFNSFLKSYQELETRYGFSLFICDLSTEIARAAPSICSLPSFLYTPEVINRIRKIFQSPFSDGDEEPMLSGKYFAARKHRRICNSALRIN